MEALPLLRERQAEHPVEEAAHLELLLAPLLRRVQPGASRLDGGRVRREVRQHRAVARVGGGEQRLERLAAPRGVQIEGVERA